MESDEAEQVARFRELSPAQRAMLLSARSSPLSRQSDLRPNPPKTPKSLKHAAPGRMTLNKGSRFQAEDSHA